MVVDYQLGKIYKLSSPSKNLIYYGSTAQKHISTRIAGHIGDYKLYLNNKGDYVYSFKVLECEDYKYELIEEYPCNNKKQLKTRERWYIQNNECVNKYIPGRTHAEYYQDNIDYYKEYREANEEYFKEYAKKYRTNNKDIIKANKREKISCECGCEVTRPNFAAHKKSQKHIRLMELVQNKEYKEVNKDKILEQTKEYKEVNKDKILEQTKEYKKQKITCKCGCDVRRDNIAKHKRTQKHIILCSIKDISVVT